MRISDWSSDVCSSDLNSCRVRIDSAEVLDADCPRFRGRRSSSGVLRCRLARWRSFRRPGVRHEAYRSGFLRSDALGRRRLRGGGWRSEEHTSELQSLMRISYAVFCLKKKKRQITQVTQSYIT